MISHSVSVILGGVFIWTKDVIREWITSLVQSWQAGFLAMIGRTSHGPSGGQVGRGARGARRGPPFCRSDLELIPPVWTTRVALRAQYHEQRVDHLSGKPRTATGRSSGPLPV